MGHLLAALDIVDLRAAIAARGDEPTILAEAHAADHALVRKVVDQLDVQPSLHSRVEHRVPVLSHSLQVGRKLLGVEIGQLVADALQLGRAILEVDTQRRIRIRMLIRRRCRTSHSWRAWIRVGLVLLGCGWPAEAATTKARVTWARRGRRLRRLRPVAW